MVGKIKEYYKPGDDKLIFVKKGAAGVEVGEKDAVRAPEVVRVEAPDPVLTA